MSNIGSVRFSGVYNVNPLYDPKTEAPKAEAKDVKSSGGLMSGAELMAKMKGAPKSDVTLFGRTVKTNSVEYKGVLNDLQAYQKHAGERKLGDSVGGLKAQLGSVIAAVDAYEAKHAASTGKADRRGVMGELKAMAQAELANLDKLGTLQNTQGLDLSVGEALALVRGGVKDASMFNRALSDAPIDMAKSKIGFGAGKANVVSLLAYNDGNDMRVVKGVSKEAEKLMLGESTTGFDQKDMRTAARNAASGNVAEALGIPNAVPKIDVVVFNGSAAVAMLPAKGESLIHKHNVPVTDAGLIKDYNAFEKSGWTENLKNASVSRDKDGNWQKSVAGYKAIPYTGTSNPPLTASIQKGLLDLQAMDCLMAQMDRQPENIFVRVQGDTAEIVGIDNDMCLGKDMTKLDALSDTSQIRVELKTTYGGPPPLMSRDMFNALKGLSEDDFKAALGPEFTADEVSNAVGRLALLKTHADGLEVAGRVIDDFETGTVRNDAGADVSVSDFLMAADTGRSYVRRDATTLGKIASPFALDMSKH